MFDRSGDPHSIVIGKSWTVAQCEHDFLFHVNGQTAKHGACPGIEFDERIKHKLMRDLLALDDDFVGSGKWSSASAGLRHRNSSYCFDDPSDCHVEREQAQRSSRGVEASLLENL